MESNVSWWPRLGDGAAEEAETSEYSDGVLLWFWNCGGIIAQSTPCGNAALSGPRDACRECAGELWNCPWLKEGDW
jgi:hypothetical protein